MKEDRQKTSYICINFKNEKIADLEAHVNHIGFHYHQ